MEMEGVCEWVDEGQGREGWFRWNMVGICLPLMLVKAEAHDYPGC